MDTESQQLKRCPKCGKFFGCSKDGDCWCHHVQVPKKNMMLIMEEYSDCLCQSCLKDYETL